jgi:hypothetical protein
MTHDETLRCQRGEELVCAECDCSFAIFLLEERCALKYTDGESTEEKVTKRPASSLHCRRCAVECVDEQQSWIASYVRMRLRAMAGDVFSVSRHTSDFAASTLTDRFFSETDAVIKRILDLAALRYLRDGSSTVTQEDVALALRLTPHAGQPSMKSRTGGN